MTDEEIMSGIAEYRVLQAIFFDLKQDRKLFGSVMFMRMMKLNETMWPHRNEKFKEYNDSLVRRYCA